MTKPQEIIELRPNGIVVAFNSGDMGDNALRNYRDNLHRALKSTGHASVKMVNVAEYSRVELLPHGDGETKQ